MATDYDDPRTGNARLTYRIQRNKEFGEVPVFSIQPETGKIFANVRPPSASLDYKAKWGVFGDGPGPGELVPAPVRHRSSRQRCRAAESLRARNRPDHVTSLGFPLLWIRRVDVGRVLDVNDNPPHFPRSRYEGSVSEDAPIEAPVLTVRAPFLNCRPMIAMGMGLGALVTHLAAYSDLIFILVPAAWVDQFLRASLCDLTLKPLDSPWFQSDGREMLIIGLSCLHPSTHPLNFVSLS